MIGDNIPVVLTRAELERLIGFHAAKELEAAVKKKDYKAAMFHQERREQLARIGTGNIDPVLINNAVDRFLGWRLPNGFTPDCGITFVPSKHPNSWPIGTNLLSDPQAREMFQHCLKMGK
jgi:hypothetical protein